MNIRVIEKVEFSKEEKDALDLIANMSCQGVGCSVCPFCKGKLCIKGEIEDIARTAEVYNEQRVN